MVTAKKLSAEAAASRLETLCARRECCTYDLMKKLSGWGISHDDASAIVEKLERQNFVDDARYAEAFVRDKYRFARWGRRKIRMGLVAKHIGRHDIESALEAVDSEEYEDLMMATLRAKIRTMPDDTVKTYEGRMKLLRFAVGRGYEPDLVIHAMESGSLWD